MSNNKLQRAPLCVAFTTPTATPAPNGTKRHLSAANGTKINFNFYLWHDLQEAL